MKHDMKKFLTHFVNFVLPVFLLASCAPEAKKDVTPSPVVEPTSTAFETARLTCEDFVVSIWGDGPGQWGFPDGLEDRPATLFPLKVDHKGNVYFADYINYRLLKYDKYELENSSSIEISLKSLVLWERPFPFKFAIALYQDKILIPFNGHYIAPVQK